MMRQQVPAERGRFRWGNAFLVVGLVAVMGLGYFMVPRRSAKSSPADNPAEQTPVPLVHSRALDSNQPKYGMTPPVEPLLAAPAEIPQPPQPPAREPLPPQPPIPVVTPPPKPPAPAGQQGKPRPTKEELDRAREVREAKLKALKLRTISRKADRADADETVLKMPKTPYHLSAGALIPLITEDKISSDAPGVASFVVRETVYDSITGQYPMVPYGAKILVQTSGGQRAGTERFPVTALTLTYPETGAEVEMRAAHVGDASGQSGLSDQIDRKTGAIIATVLIQMFARSTTAAMAGGAAGSAAEDMASAAVRDGVQGGSAHAKTFLNTSPTFTIRDAYLATLRLEKSISLPAPYPFVGVAAPVAGTPRVGFRGPGR
jgi:type IV secretory pathway VirB10-like protein